MPNLNLWIMPFILTCLWIWILLQLRRGVREGTIGWYRRSGGDEDRHHDNDSYREEDRRVRKYDFYSLFVTYCLCAVAIPVIVVIAIIKIMAVEQ